MLTPREDTPFSVHSDDYILNAIESRAVFVYFEPSWAEVYREVCTWFTDQESADYIHERIPVLKRPDVRIFVKAQKLKAAALDHFPWREIIDAHVDDPTGLLVRQLMDDQSFRTNQARAQEFVKRSGQDRATFYRQLADIRAYRPESAADVKRLKVCDTATGSAVAV